MGSSVTEMYIAATRECLNSCLLSVTLSHMQMRALPAILHTYTVRVQYYIYRILESSAGGGKSKREPLSFILWVSRYGGEVEVEVILYSVHQSLNK